MLNRGKAKETIHTTQGHSTWSETKEEDVDNPWWARNPADRPHTKVEFLKFESEDPQGWILKAEKYFLYYQMLEELKVDIAALFLDGDALDYFAWVSRERTLLY